MHKTLGLLSSKSFEMSKCSSVMLCMSGVIAFFNCMLMSHSANDNKYSTVFVLPRLTAKKSGVALSKSPALSMDKPRGALMASLINSMSSVFEHK